MFDAIAIAIFLIVIDIGIVGFLPTILRLSPSIRDIDKNEIIIHGSISRLQYKTANKWLNSRINNVGGLKLILTKDFLYIQERILSYAVKLPIREMKQFSVMRKDLVGKVFGDRIEIETEFGKIIRFRSEKIEEWKNALLQLGIPNDK